MIIKVARAAALIALVVLGHAACQSSAPRPDAEAAKRSAFTQDLRTLADDAFEGREAGTPGYDRAAAFVAERFAEAGLAPGGGDGGYLQRVAFRGFALEPNGFAVDLVRPGEARQALTLGEHYVPSAHPIERRADVEADVVFAGYGISDPERGRDDYAGVDVRGKIVAVLDGAPAYLPSEERAYFGSGRTKIEAAAARGAIAMVSLETPTSAKRAPFSRRLEGLGSTRLALLDDEGAPVSEAPEILATLSVSAAAAARLMPDWDEVIAAAEAAEGRTNARPLGLRLAIRARSAHSSLTSANVVGVLAGVDPALKDELVVLTAHLDHLGVRGSGEDRIHNGAIDNAAGVAALIETARMFAKATPPRRTLVFVAVTAEEKGLVGSEHFAKNPSVAGRIVANVNLDMPILLYDFEDVTAFGAERSSLGGVVAAAAESLGASVAPDPFPEQAIFVRSDHYGFVRQGAPSVMLATGWGGAGEAAWKRFLDQHYHRASDDLSLPIDFDAGVKFARINYEIARRVADADAAPVWRSGDFFAERFDGPMADTPR